MNNSAKSDVASLFDLSGQVALVTGSCAGLGLAMARALAQAGARVVINGRDRARTEAVAHELRNEGLDATGLAFDVTDGDRAGAAIDTLIEAEARLDILVNNVGLRHRVTFEEMEPQDFAAVLDGNLTAVYRITRKAAVAMIERGHGRIIMMSSAAAARPGAAGASYAASKAGLEALTRSLAIQLGGRGVTCNAIAPGAFLTPTNVTLAETLGKHISDSIPLGRWGDPSELMGPALFLASSASSYITGHVLYVDGGYMVQ